MRNEFTDPFAEEDATSNPFTWTLSSKSTRKRTAARTPQTLNKRSGITMASDEHFDVEEGLDSDETVDEHDDTSDETVVVELKVS
ncbi:hypothetical protein BGZ59_003386 [Podila verticillata]|nr:hypothetical protein BGZ59_003386 [Podila verticillata]